jgi:hypothetical protein
MNIKYGLIVLDPIPDENGKLGVFHFCGYENRPTDVEIEDLRRELETDEEFGLTDRMNDLIIREALPSVVEFYRERFQK